jgi:hypothetical protein
VFENRVLRKILEPKRNRVRVEWRILRGEELYELHFSSNVILVKKQKIIVSAGHMARMGER